MIATLALICALLAASIAPQPAVPRGASEQPMTLVCAVPIEASRTGRGTDSGCVRAALASMPAFTRGTASWFDARGYQGAVPWWVPGQSPVWATLSRFADGKTYSVTLLVTGFCQCLAGQPGERLIDLSPAAFRSLGVSLSVGLIRVTMTVPVQGPRLPATDSEEGP